MKPFVIRWATCYEIAREQCRLSLSVEFLPHTPFSKYLEEKRVGPLALLIADEVKMLAQMFQQKGFTVIQIEIFISENGSEILEREIKALFPNVKSKITTGRGATFVLGSADSRLSFTIIESQITDFIEKGTVKQEAPSV